MPYTMPRYNDADVKIFYMGRDTYYWVEQEELFEAFTNHVLEDYLGKNAACVDVEKCWDGKITPVPFGQWLPNCIY